MATNFEVVSLLENIRFQFNRGVQAFFVYQGVASDGQPPLVSLVSPAAGALDAATAIVVDVTDQDLGQVIVAARFESLGVEEVVHQGTRFSAAYAGGSSRAAISGGWRYTIRRGTGWPAAPTIDVYAIDTGGIGT